MFARIRPGCRVVVRPGWVGWYSQAESSRTGRPPVGAARCQSDAETERFVPSRRRAREMANLHQAALTRSSAANYRMVLALVAADVQSACGALARVRSGMGAYAGAARRRFHLTTVLLRPLSGHRPDRRQARHACIFQIVLHLTQP